MIDPKQFVAEIISPTLDTLGLNSLAARRLLLGTAVAESGLVYLRQNRGGPALGLYQTEPATHRDLYENFLRFDSELRDRAIAFAAQNGSDRPDDRQLIFNLAYSTAVARLDYYREPEALPDADDFGGLASYWKRFYNSMKGAGTVPYFLRKTRKYLADVT